MFRYFPKKSMMNKKEHDFYTLLCSFIDAKYSVVPQVHFDDLVKPSAYFKGKYWLSLFRSINQKSVDFAICDKETMRPLLAVELDGQSHQTTLARDQDKKKKRILDEAGIRLIRFKNSDLDNPEKIISEIADTLASQK